MVVIPAIHQLRSGEGKVASLALSEFENLAESPTVRYISACGFAYGLTPGIRHAINPVHCGLHCYVPPVGDFGPALVGTGCRRFRPDSSEIAKSRVFDPKRFREVANAHVSRERLMGGSCVLEASPQLDWPAPADGSAGPLAWKSVRLIAGIGDGAPAGSLARAAVQPVSARRSWLTGNYSVAHARGFNTGLPAASVAPSLAVRDGTFLGDPKKIANPIGLSHSGDLAEDEVAFMGSRPQPIPVGKIIF